ncbi:MAG: hypothetical protein WCR72_01920 [Bacteroidota bacterium]
MTESERLSAVINYLGLNTSEFARSLGMDNPVSIYHVIRGRNGVSSELANRIISVHPNLNMGWLLFGQGEMLLSGNKPEYSDKSIINLIDQNKKLVEIVEELTDQVKKKLL